MPTPKDMAAQLIAECERGFRDEFHWQGWLKKNGRLIASLPIPLAKQVSRAWSNATAIVEEK